MTPLRTFGRWLADWRNGATAIGTLLSVLLVFVVVNAIESRNAALDVAEATAEDSTAQRKATTRRIDLLLERTGELEAAAVVNGERIGELVAEVNALREQVRQMGGEPVVDAPEPDGRRAAPSDDQTDDEPPPSPPPPGPSPPPDDEDEPAPCLLPVAVLCEGEST